MRNDTFVGHIDGIDGLDVVGLCGDDEIAVMRARDGVTMAVPIDHIANRSNWPMVVDVLLGRRDPRVLTQMTRIVGYFSQVQNWNRSKHEELRDRHFGDYEVRG